MHYGASGVPQAFLKAEEVASGENIGEAFSIGCSAWTR
jgi:hypothetical protein